MPIDTKDIVEEIQGNSTQVDLPVKPNGKKLYLESYGC